jgi:hypothetical protein
MDLVLESGPSGAVRRFDFGGSPPLGDVLPTRPTGRRERT